MLLSGLFDTFSKRSTSTKSSEKSLTQAFRNRVLMRCRDLLHGTIFWDEIHAKLTYLHGRPRLTDIRTDERSADALQFLNGCIDEHFLDFIEYIFRTQAYYDYLSGRGDLVENINVFFQQDDLPYSLTDFVWTSGHNGRNETITLTGYPQVISKNSEVLHIHAIQPTLQLLRKPGFEAANKEFLQALEDFRKADYADCLIKCGSSFESVLKVICTKKQWAYQPNETASPLLRNVIRNSGLETFFEQPLIIVATIRNKLSSAHGAGPTPRNVSKAKAEYAINSTAAAILLLVEETGT